MVLIQALASTIRRDPTAPHFKFHDDPYLTPVSNAAKRSFALSQESGRKAAMWVKEQHPELFQRIESDPPIQVSISFMYYTGLQNKSKPRLIISNFFCTFGRLSSQNLLTTNLTTLMKRHC